MALTDAQRKDLQGDLGIGSDGNILTDQELDRLYARADSDYNLAMAYALRQLLAMGAKFSDYTAGDNSEKKSQVFKHLKELYDEAMQEAGGGDAAPLAYSIIEQDLIEPYSVTEYSNE